LLPTSISLWHHVLSSGNDQAMITLTGLIIEALTYFLTNLHLSLMIILL
jgi:hypothetical protein